MEGKIVMSLYSVSPLPHNQPHLEVVLTSDLDEGTSGAYRFLSEFGEGTALVPHIDEEARSVALYRLSDASGRISFERLPSAARALLSSDDAFLLDDSKNPQSPAVYVWVGKHASVREKRGIVQYAQQFLYQERETHRGKLGVAIIKMEEGNEVDGFFTGLE